MQLSLMFMKGEKRMAQINEKTLEVLIYRDSTGLYTEEECDRENLMYIGLPEGIVRQWFSESRISEEYDSFEEWLHSYTADSTDGLYYYAMSHGSYCGNILAQ